MYPLSVHLWIHFQKWILLDPNTFRSPVNGWIGSKCVQIGHEVDILMELRQLQHGISLAPRVKHKVCKHHGCISKVESSCGDYDVNFIILLCLYAVSMLCFMQHRLRQGQLLARIFTSHSAETKKNKVILANLCQKVKPRRKKRRFLVKPGRTNVWWLNFVKDIVIAK